MAWTMQQDIKFMKWESLYSDIAMVGQVSRQTALMDEMNQRLAMEQQENVRMRAAMAQDRADERWFRFSIWRDNTTSGWAYNAWERHALSLLHEMDEGARRIGMPLTDDLNDITSLKVEADPKWGWATDSANVKALPTPLQRSRTVATASLVISAVAAVIIIPVVWAILGRLGFEIDADVIGIAFFVALGVCAVSVLARRVVEKLIGYWWARHNRLSHLRCAAGCFDGDDHVLQLAGSRWDDTPGGVLIGDLPTKNRYICTGLELFGLR